MSFLPQKDQFQDISAYKRKLIEELIKVLDEEEVYRLLDEALHAYEISDLEHWLECN